MCNSELNSGQAVAQIDGRPVLQPAGNSTNRVLPLDPCIPVKKSLQKSLSLPSSFGTTTAIPTTKAITAATSVNDASQNSATLNLDSRSDQKTEGKKRSKKSSAQRIPVAAVPMAFGQLDMTNFSTDRAPAGSIAAKQREHAALQHAQRKMRIAHYGRTISYSRNIDGKVEAADPSTEEGIKRCSFITPFSDPVYIAYHDREWGVPVHDDKMLFELLVVSGLQVGSDWTTILKKRAHLREAFAGFDANLVSKFTEKQMTSISTDIGLDMGTIRGIVNNADQILAVKSSFGSLDKYIWGFVNHKPLLPSYKSCRKIPVKTSKSESISKDMVRRGFRFVGPTVIHSFMQAAGLTNDHLVSCPWHRSCLLHSSLTSQKPSS